MGKVNLQPEASEAVSTSGIFGKGRAPSVFPRLPPDIEELRAERVVYFHDILNTLPEMAFELDSEGRISFINDTALNMLGLSRSEAAGAALASFASAGRASEWIGRALSGENPGPLEYSMRRSDGTELPVRCTLTIIMNEERVIGLRGIATDMTETVRMRGELERAERRKAAYESAARSGHDLRNVLCAIKGATEFMRTIDLRRLSSTDITDIQESLRDQLEAVERGTRLTDDMTQLAGAERISWGRVDMGAVIDAIARERRQQCSSKGITLVCVSEPGTVLRRGDRHKLHRAIDNIVANAIDSMERGGLLEVSASPGDIDGRPAVHLRVKDTGCGIEPQLIDRIFDPFMSTKGSKGTGLGLAIAAAVIDAHEGRIDVKSEVGAGTEFSILVPS